MARRRHGDGAVPGLGRGRRVSVLDHPAWSRLAPLMVVVRGDHVRVAFEKVPDDLAELLDLYMAACMGCGRPCFPFRIRPRIGYEISYDYHPSCARAGCKPGLRVSNELGKLAIYAAGAPLLTHSQSQR